VSAKQGRRDVASRDSSEKSWFGSDKKSGEANNDLQERSSESNSTFPTPNLEDQLVNLLGLYVQMKLQMNSSSPVAEAWNSRRRWSSAENTRALSEQEGDASDDLSQGTDDDDEISIALSD